MMASKSSPLSSKKILVITSSGGGGLIQAAVAKEQEALAKDPQVVTIRKDVLRDWTWKWFGRFCIRCWNGAQQSGNVRAQSFYLASQTLADYLFWFHIFFRSLRLLFKEEIDRVVDTQPFGTSAILKAIRLFNWRKERQLFLEKVLVDLPTPKATHFFRSIKRLTKGDRNCLKLTTIAPLLKEGETEADFWKSNCNLSAKEICYEDVYVRQAFKKFQGKARPLQPMELSLRFKSAEELQLMRRSFQRGPIRARHNAEAIHFQVAPEDRVITILLGSQPAKSATLAYVSGFLDLAKETTHSKAPIHLFVFASHHREGKETLFRKISNFVAQTKGYPSHLSIIPFSFQSDEAIAPLFFRSDLTCTRSGGQTAMELMCVSSGEIWIHSEAKSLPGQELSLDQLLKGIPGWESANALYLHKMQGGKIVTPETFSSLARELFCPVDEAQSPPSFSLVSTA